MTLEMQNLRSHKNNLFCGSVSKKHTTIFLFFLIFSFNEYPAAIGIVVPTTAEVPITPFLISTKCIDPPRPPAQPVSFPNNSAKKDFKPPPRARKSCVRSISI